MFMFVYLVFICFILHICHITVMWWGGPDGIKSQSLRTYFPSVADALLVGSFNAGTVNVLCVVQWCAVYHRTSRPATTVRVHISSPLKVCSYCLLQFINCFCCVCLCYEL